jgi:addiction module RelE/StbE family toxin
MAMNVYWTHSAQKDRIKLFKFWNEKTVDSSYSETLNQLILDKLFQTRLFPDSGLETERKEIRALIIEKQYKLFYCVRKDAIVVLRLLGI